MAIILEEQKNPTNWGAFITILLIIGIVGAGTYYLFFAPTPGIDVIIPTKQKLNQELSSIEIPTATIESNQTYQSLRTYAGPPTAGQVGRTNPFIKF